MVGRRRRRRRGTRREEVWEEVEEGEWAREEPRQEGESHQVEGNREEGSKMVLRTSSRKQ